MSDLSQLDVARWISDVLLPAEADMRQTGWVACFVRKAIVPGQFSKRAKHFNWRDAQ
jgi:hypothetical protein